MEERCISHSHIPQSEVRLRSNSIRAASKLHEWAERGNSDGNVFCVQEQRELLGVSATGKLKSKSQAFLIQLLPQIASLTLQDLVLHDLPCAPSVLVEIVLLGCYVYSVRMGALGANARGNTSDGYNSTGSQWLRCLARVHPAW